MNGLIDPNMIAQLMAMGMGQQQPAIQPPMPPGMGPQANNGMPMKPMMPSPSGGMPGGGGMQTLPGSGMPMPGGPQNMPFSGPPPQFQNMPFSGAPPQFSPTGGGIQTPGFGMPGPGGTPFGGKAMTPPGPPMQPTPGMNMGNIGGPGMNTGTPQLPGQPQGTMGLTPEKLQQFQELMKKLQAQDGQQTPPPQGLIPQSRAGAGMGSMQAQPNPAFSQAIQQLQQQQGAGGPGMRMRRRYYGGG